MRVRLLAALLAAIGVAPVAAQEAIPGYSPAAAAGQRRIEAAAIAAPEAENARRHSWAMTREPHVAGTDAQARNRDYVIDQMRSWGLETEIGEYEIWLPHATSVRVWRVSPDPIELPLQEPPVPGDSTTYLPQYPPANGYTGSGDVSAELVYVNYGLVEDYATLDSLGVSVDGKIAIARYGRSFRGIKAREAEKHGAVALLMFSDPADDGYMRGDVYPDGPMRPPTSVQRGSVLNMLGDPSTPGYGSVSGAERIPIEEMAVPRIPVAPLSYANAEQLLRDLRGTDIPQTWQGGLPFRYHLGPGPVVARVAIAIDTATAAFKPVWNTYGIIRGSELPEQLVVIGAHRDAWGTGAVDNISGTVSVLQAARVIAEQVERGIRPRRTIIFATWDAEEWGIIGSTEYVEDDSLRLQRGAVAYLNQDGTVSGPNFAAGGSPSLRETLRDVIREVPHPNGEGTVYAVWREQSGVGADEPRMGDPGGGSDFAGFYNHLGIPHSDWGFGGPYGVYHSAYDSYDWLTEFADPGFEYHATAARIAAAMVLRLANAEVLPYDYVEFATTMRLYLPGVDSMLAGAGWDLTSTGLAASIAGMGTAAREFAAARDAALAGGGASDDVLEEVNVALLRVERSLTRPEGLRTRPWYRNVIYAADENNGYSNVVFPSVIEAIRSGDRALTERELLDLENRFDAATAHLVAATRALE
jgi:N-acetylated-alpha-linked acidic dipeptidase